VYATCLFCHRPLGRNEVVEAFPVGRRLAFDAARGRLWVVCPSCERWNLTPVEERWEAIEACERRFRATPLRASTENVGLARLPEGLDLVRIGRPLRPEFAAWRYGHRLGRRRRRQQLLVGGGTLAAIGAAVVGGAVVGGAALVAVGAIQLAVWRALGGRRPDEVVAVLRGETPEPVVVCGTHLADVRVWGDERELHLDLRRGDAAFAFVGDAAQRALAALVPHVNRGGALPAEVGDAVAMIQAAGDPAAYLAGYRGPVDEGARSWARVLFLGGDTRRGLAAIPSTERLALEMAAHEEEERRFAEGELAHLEEAWRAAEEIASIADTLLTPPEIEVALRRLTSENPEAASTRAPPSAR
jgi:hypothetical protein